MTYVRLTLIALAVTSGLLVVSSHSRPALAGAAPAIGTSSESTTTPAAHVVVVRALHVRKQAVAAWLEWGRARSAFSLRMVRFNQGSARRPDRSASGAVWLAARLAWLVDRDAYKARTAKLVERMRHPGGNGAARWAPLLRWCGWGEFAIPGAIAIMTRESSGSPHEWNHQGSGCYGLFQLSGCWWPKRGYSWIYDPMNQARLAWHIFHVIQHNSWLPAWGL